MIYYQRMQMTTTRSGAGGSGGSDNAGNDRELPPPPPPPTAEQLFAQFLGSQRNIERLLRENLGRNNQRPEPNQYSTFKDFMDTKPPIFKEAAEPLEAEEWLHTMEQKFRLLRLMEELKAEYAAHQLQGPAGIWWGHHRTTYPPHAPVTWDMFTRAVRGHYIPQGLMEMKAAEFMSLTQGTRSMMKYH